MIEAIRKNATFATTHWTVVLKARDPSAPEAVAALEDLCRTYWYPLYACARSKGLGIEQAKDLTQGFFARLLEKNYLGVADRRKGKFRWFLLTAFKCFLANEHDREQAQKRGGGQTPLPLDMASAEDLHQLDQCQDEPPDRSFDRRWALTLLENVRQQLRDEYAAAGKSGRYAALESCLPGEPPARPHAETALELGISPGAVKVEVHRMKQRYGELLRAAVARTVANENEVEGELLYLIEVLSASPRGSL